MTCTTMGATCGCTGATIPCGDSRLSADVQLLQMGHLPGGDDVRRRPEDERMRLRLRLPVRAAPPEAGTTAGTGGEIKAGAVRALPLRRAGAAGPDVRPAPPGTPR